MKQEKVKIKGEQKKWGRLKLQMPQITKDSDGFVQNNKQNSSRTLVNDGYRVSCGKVGGVTKAK